MIALNTPRRPKDLRRRLNPKPYVSNVEPMTLLKGSVRQPLTRREIPHDLGQLFQGFALGMSALDEAYDELDGFARAIVEANTVGSRPMRVSLDRPMPKDVANVATAVRPLNEVHAILVDELEAQRGGLVPATERMLEAFVTRKMCGLIDWFAPDKARYSYFTWTVNDETLSSRVNRSARNPLVEVVKTVGRQTVVGQMTVHDLIHATPFELPAAHVPRPPRVDQLIQRIPSWLRPEVRIVQGTQIRSETVEVYRGVSQWTHFFERPAPPRPQYRSDPALVLGCYTLAGWDENEGVVHD